MRRSYLLTALFLFLGAQSDLAVTQALSPAEREELELLRQPESWFLEQAGGTRRIVDGQALDPKLQYLLARSGQRGTPQENPLLTAERRAAMRASAERSWIFRTRITAEMAEVRNMAAKGRHGEIPVRVYWPKLNGAGQLPILVYFHGGGWIFGSLDASDRVARLIANEARVILVSVDYRLAPEHPYPVAWDDAEDAWNWVRANAAALGGDTAHIGVGGDSAGGNLALAVSARQRAARRPMPVYQLLYYPAVDLKERAYRSWTLFGEDYGLDRSFAELAIGAVFSGRDLDNPEISPIMAKSVRGMPATILASAGFDMLRDSGRAYADRLEREGVSVTYLNYDTLNHSFLQNSGVIEDAERAATQTAQIFGQAIRSRIPRR